jgi:hypothetical protein
LYFAVRRIYLACAEQEASHEVVYSYLDNPSPFLQEDHMPRSVTSVICTLEHDACEDLAMQTRNQTPENNNKTFHKCRKALLLCKYHPESMKQHERIL